MPFILCSRIFDYQFSGFSANNSSKIKCSTPESCIELQNLAISFNSNQSVEDLIQMSLSPEIHKGISPLICLAFTIC